MRVDILVTDFDGSTILAVEVKARRGVDRTWARQLRRNLVAHGGEPVPRFFMVVTTDWSFLWHGLDPTNQLDADPTEVAATRELMGDRMPPLADHLDGRVLELVVSAWLNSLAEGVVVTDVTPDVESFLIASGLQRALSSTGAAVSFAVA